MFIRRTVQQGIKNSRPVLRSIANGKKSVGSRLLTSSGSSSSSSRGMFSGVSSRVSSMNVNKRVAVTSTRVVSNTTSSSMGSPLLTSLRHSSPLRVVQRSSMSTSSSSSSSSSTSMSPRAMVLLGAALSSGLIVSAQFSQTDEKSLVHGEEKKVFKIVLTGGPCAGKSTAMSHLAKRLEGEGFKVYILPEVPTIMITAGASFVEMTSQDEFMAFENGFLRMQMIMEDSFVKMAEASGRKVVILCDRGMMDAGAYIEDDMFTTLLEENGLTSTNARDKRYDGVIHMITAAYGAEKFYTKANNAARTETVEQARHLDDAVKKMYVGHPRMRVIDNSTGFMQKVARTTQAVCRIVGANLEDGELPEVERKFTVTSKSVRKLKIPVDYEQFRVEQILLKTSNPGPGGPPRIVRRGQQGVWSYYYRTKEIIGGEVIALERPINGREFMSLKKQRDENYSVLGTTRYTFLYKNRYYELDIRDGPANAKGYAVLRYNGQRESDMELPDFLQVQEEVTGKKEYETVNLMRK